MSRKKALKIGLAALAAVLVTSAWLCGHHVIRTDRGMIVTGKRFVGLGGTFCDIRGWSAKEFRDRPDVTQALRADGYGDLVVDTRLRTVRDELSRLRQETSIQWGRVRVGLARRFNAGMTALADRMAGEDAEPKS
jgi:hypothetical protein